MALLFEPLTVRDVEFPNRIMVSPMCQYSAIDGFATDWHLVHLGARAVGRAGTVMLETTSVSPEGRISHYDLGIWRHEHCEMLSRIARFMRNQGSVPAIQIGHAGRKASQRRPWDGGGPLQPNEHPWTTMAPSAIPFDSDWHTPVEMTQQDIRRIVNDFRVAARRSFECGYELLEVHCAHGYLLNQFLGEASNQRVDEYGGSFDNHLRLVLNVIDAVREEWPERLPLGARISATDWSPGGWDIAESVELVNRLAERGVDIVDVSSGGNVAGVTPPDRDDYQTALAAEVRKQTGLTTVAVGKISTSSVAECLLTKGGADFVAIGREFLRSPHWPLQAARELGAEIEWPAQYRRARI